MGGVYHNSQSLPSRKNLNWWPICLEGFFCVLKYHLSREAHFTEMNRRSHWDIIREGWFGKWQLSCWFGLCYLLVSISCSNTINILYLVLIEAVTLGRHIIASWPNKKRSYISLFAVICQTDWLRLYPRHYICKQAVVSICLGGKRSFFRKAGGAWNIFFRTCFFFYIISGGNY